MPRPITRPIIREIATPAGTPLVVRLTAHGLEIREKRRRRAFLLPWGVAFVQAVRIDVEAARRQKAAERRARRGRGA